MTRAVAALVVVAALLAASWFALPVWKVDVSGTRHLRPREVARLAGVLPGNPWLWVSSARVAPLTRDPWVEKVSLVKTFPGKVAIHVTERRPAAVQVRADGREVVIARDLTPLPGPVKPTMRPRVRLSGWGGADRLREALEIAVMLNTPAYGGSGYEGYKVREVRYTPKGFTVLTDRYQIWTDSYASLRKHGGGVRMYDDAPQSDALVNTAPRADLHNSDSHNSKTSKSERLRVSVYPWGVSVFQ